MGYCDFDLKSKDTRKKCSNICFPFLCFFLAISVLFGQSIVWNSSSSQEYFGSGPYTLSNEFKPIGRVGFTIYGNLSVIYYSDLDSTICSDSVDISYYISQDQTETATINNYKDFGSKYGFCDSPNGSYSTPSEISVLRASLITVTVLAFFSMVIQFLKVKISVMLFNIFLNLVNFILSCVIISQVSSWQFYKDLRNGNAYSLERDMNNQLFAEKYDQPVSYGSNFWSFILLIICSLFSTIMFILEYIRIRRNRANDIEFNGEDDASPKPGTVVPGYEGDIVLTQV